MLKVKIPSQRNPNHFDIDDPVYVYRFEDGKWYFGHVRNGYRHHDGCVSFRLFGIGPQDEDTEPATSLFSQGGYWGMGFAVPNVLKKEEYEWFKSHPEEYFEWCQHAYPHKYGDKKLSPAIIPGTEKVFAKSYLNL